ncbi:MAG: maltose alpha-D-glucosyltransferase [Desulfovibrionales bacterium]|nr:maltose alpha-D-glucosyltransferase [Desulfovibrionales bacterium]
MKKKTTHKEQDPLWYKDAILYELHIKSFYDSTGNGRGDICGVVEKLDYLKELGVTALWLLPFYPSPLRDDGYDIQEYQSVHPDYGTVEDLQLLITEAHARGLRVITELVLNHTSDQHPWFQRARRAPKGSVHRDFYVWSDTPEKYQDARIIFTDFESSNWSWDAVAQAYYWHRFYHHQPDLNFENPHVHDAIFAVFDFWFAMGIDGVRLDAVPYLYEEEGTNCENLPKTFAFLKRLRKRLDAAYSGKMLLAEANQWPEDAARYFGDGDACHMSFHFPLMPRMFMALVMEDRFPILDILEQTPDIPEDAQWAIFLRNHDELTLEMVTDEERDYMYRMYARDPESRINVGIRRRLAPLLDNDRRKIELMNVLLFTMPGTPVLYYGDEIAMGDNYHLEDRDGVRTPMQWTDDRNAGFSRAQPQQLYLPVIIDPEYHYECVNVAAARENTASLFWWTKNMIAMRNMHPVFGRGTIQFLLPQHRSVLAYLRSYEEETVLVVCNLSRFPHTASLDLSAFAGNRLVDCLTQSSFPEITKALYPLTLSSYGYFILNITASDATTSPNAHDLVSVGYGNVEQLFDTEGRRSVQHILMSYWRKQPWLLNDSRTLHAVRIQEAVPLGNAGQPYWLLVLDVQFVHHDAEVHTMLVSILTGSAADAALEEREETCICLLHHDATAPEDTDGAPAINGKDRGMEATPPYTPLCDCGQHLEHTKAAMREVFIDSEDAPARLADDLVEDGTSTGQQQAVLVEGVSDNWQCDVLVRFVEQPHPLRGDNGVVTVEQGTTPLPDIISLRGRWEKNANVYTVVCGNTLFGSFYRTLTDVVACDAEMLAYLSNDCAFPCVPDYYGALLYHADDGATYHLGAYSQYVQHETDMQTVVQDCLLRFCDSCLDEGVSVGEATVSSLFDLVGVPDEEAGEQSHADEGQNNVTAENGRQDFEAAPSGEEPVKHRMLTEAEQALFGLLGTRVGELHCALAASTERIAFAPEQYSTLYARSVYQSVQSVIKRTLAHLEEQRDMMDNSVIPLADALLAKREPLLQGVRTFLQYRYGCQKIRIHGTLSLQKVLCAGNDVCFVDFTGQKYRSQSARRLKDCALQDVVDLLVSLERTVQETVRYAGLFSDEDVQHLTPCVEQWCHHCEAVLLQQYLETVQGYSIVPDDIRAVQCMVDVFSVQKILLDIQHCDVKDSAQIHALLQAVLELHCVQDGFTT